MTIAQKTKIANDFIKQFEANMNAEELAMWKLLPKETRQWIIGGSLKLNGKI